MRASNDVRQLEPCVILVAALGDRMLQIAGSEAEGTILWMVGPRAIERHVAPKLRAAAREAGRTEPRIVAGMHIALTANPRAGREKIEKRLHVYGQMPSYRAMLEKEGPGGREHMALVGDESVLDAGLQRLRDLGVSDFEASIVRVEEGSEERTLRYLEKHL